MNAEKTDLVYLDKVPWQVKVRISESKDWDEKLMAVHIRR